MPDSRTPDLATIQPIEASGLSTTARLLVSFVKTYFGVPDKPYDSVLARSTSIYVEFGQLFEKLDAYNDEANTRGVTRDIFEKLKNATTPSAKTSYDNLRTDAEEALSQSENLEKRKELFRQKCGEDWDKAFEILESVLTMVTSTKDPKEKAEMLNQLIMAEKMRQSVKVEMEALQKASLVSESQLRKVANSAYAALPSKDKTTVSAPPSPTTTPTITG